jgi:SAM-dependent methyltransferase
MAKGHPTKRSKEMATTLSLARIRTIRRDTVRKIRQVGVVGTAKHGMRKVFGVLSAGFTGQQDPGHDSFDQKYATDTAQIISVGALDIPDEKLQHSNRYEAVVPEVFNAIMEDLAINYRDFAFVDIGCGKGRALLLASHFPYHKIVGVEISASLITIAEKNIRIFRDDAQRCHDLSTICTDGAAYDLPLHATVLYLNNPFDAEVMRLFRHRVEASLAAHPRRILIVYQRALHRSVWDESSLFKVARDRPRYVVYETVHNRRRRRERLAARHNLRPLRV